MELLKEWCELTSEWEPVFAQTRTWERATEMSLGMLCGLGRRTLTRALSFLGQEQADWTANYKLFSRSAWEPQELFVPVWEQGLEYLNARNTMIPVAVDDTSLKRRGKKVPGAGWLRDAMGPPFQTNLIWGQRFIQASLLLPLYRNDARASARALPVRFLEAPLVQRPARKASAEALADYQEHKKQQNLSKKFVQLAQDLRQQLDGVGQQERILGLFGDGSYCNRTVFRAPWERTEVTCRARKDLRLCFAAKESHRIYGPEKFTPLDIYQDQKCKWQTCWLYYGGRRRRVRYKEVKRVLWQRGSGRRLVRLIVLAPTPYRRTKSGALQYRDKAFLLSTDLNSTAAQLIQAYLDRFQIEFNHRDEKTVLGVGQAQVWAALSTPRVPEFLVAGYSLLLLAGLRAYGPHRGTEYIPLPKWRSPARRASCQDLVNLLRKQVAAAAQNPQPDFPLSNFRQMVLQSAA